MDKYDLFVAAISAFLITTFLNVWLDKLGKGVIGCLGNIVIFLVSAVAVFLFVLFAPSNIQTIAWIIGLGIVVLSLIVHWISQL